MKHAINWFAIPVNDIQRAAKFYSAILDADLQTAEMDGRQLAFFPADEGAISGHLFTDEHFKPGADGSLLYLNGGDDLQTVVDRIDAAGGSVVMPKTQITPEIGYFAIFMDTEGNKVALHSPH